MKYAVGPLDGPIAFPYWPVSIREIAISSSSKILGDEYVSPITITAIRRTIATQKIASANATRFLVST